MKPYYQDDAVTIYHGDCREMLLELPKVDLVLTDPPYGTGGRDGSTHRTGTTGDYLSYDAFVWATKQDSNLLFKATREGTHAYVFSDWRRYKDVQIAYEVSGWELRALIVWAKGNGMGEYWRSSHEFILFFTKRKPRKLEHGNCMNVIHEKKVAPTKRHHPLEKPIRLIQQLVVASSKDGEIILDPFMGSGSTLVAAKDLNRKAIGVEIEEKYCEIAATRMMQEVLSL